MLVATHKPSGERISAFEFNSGHELRTAFPPGELICHHCNGEVFPCERKGFVLHFVHRNPDGCTFARHSESPEHEQGKYELAKYLKQEIKDDPHQVARIEIEYPLPHCGKNGRIADAALVYDNGNLLICECQLAKITPDELERRTRDYHAIGADVIWFLGGKAYTEENRDWLQATFGAVGVLAFDYKPTQVQLNG